MRRRLTRWEPDMIDPRTPRYQWGQQVTARIDLFNDGGFPEREADALLAGAGTVGEIVQIGVHADTRTPIYLVEFAGAVIGCLEEEIGALASGPVEPQAADLPR